MEYPTTYGPIKIKKEPGTSCGQTNLIINYLPTDCAEDEMFNMFSQVGEVVKCKIVRNKTSGQSLGYGFVEFENESCAKLAQTMFDKQDLRGKSLKVAFARPQGEEIVNTNLYVAFMPLDMDENRLTALFGIYGKIIEVKVLRIKPTGQSRGAGFVRFDQHLSAKVAMNSLNQHIPVGAKRPILVQWAKGHFKSNPKKAHCCCCTRGLPLNGVPIKKEEPDDYPGPGKRYFEPEIQLAAKRYRGDAD